jgi:hypothetical protein
MGLHTGRGVLGGDDYVGLDVNRAARIAAAGHGGQVLLSDATRGLVASALPEGVRLQPLGSYRLKDLPEPEALWQVEIRGLPAAFPPLRALDVRRAHLPPDATTFVGRHVELDRLGQLVVERRLITLTGPGGTGKTRLALRAASRQSTRPLPKRWRSNRHRRSHSSVGMQRAHPEFAAAEHGVPRRRSAELRQPRAAPGHALSGDSEAAYHARHREAARTRERGVPTGSDMAAAITVSTHAVSDRR